MKSNSPKKLGLPIFLGSIALIGVVVSAALMQNPGRLLNANGVYGDTSDYTVVLDSSNKYTSGTTKEVTTSSGQWSISFEYTNASALSNGHVTLADGGKLVNTREFISLDYLKIHCDGAGTLRFRTSYDGATWGGYATVSDNEIYNLASNPYYIELTATGGSVNIYQATYQYTCVANPNAEGTPVESGTVFELVEDESDIIVGDVYTFATVNDGDGYVCTNSVASSTYYMSSAAITVSDNRFNYDSGYGFVLGGTSGAYKFTKEGGDDTPLYDGNSYQSLYYYNGSTGCTTWNINLTDHQIYSNNDNGNQNPHYIVRNANTGTWNSYQYGSSTATYLYHKVAIGGTEYDTPVDEIGFTAVDSNASGVYTTSSVYATDNGLNVKAKYSDGSETALTASQYTDKLSATRDGVAMNVNQAFGAAGVFYVTVTYGEYLPQILEIQVGVSLSSISAALTTASYTTADTISLTSNLTATLTYDDNSQQTISYANFAANNLTATVLTPAGVAYDISNPLGTAGTWKVRVSSTKVSSIYGEVSFTVSAINVQSIEMSNSSYTLTVGSQVQLTVTFNPSNATNQNVTWTSSDNTVASVSEGLVTAKKVGTATITATSQDGSKTATCALTVKKAATSTATIVSNNPTTNQNSTVSASTTGFTTNGITLTAASSSYLYGTSDGSYRFASSNNGGSLTLSFASTVITGVSINASAYGSDSPSVKVTTSANTTGETVSVSGSTASDYATAAFASDTTESTSITISSAKKNRFYLYSITLTIGVADPIYPESVSIPSAKSLYVGDTEQLTPTFSPSDTNQTNVTWSTSNSSVATVEGGLVTAVSAGTADITVTAKDENDNDLTSTCRVTVSNVAVTGVTLSDSTATITVGKTKALTATVSPSNATNKSVTWTSSNTSVATVSSSGVVTAVAAGTATITVTTADGNKTATCTVTVTNVQLDDWTIMIYMCGADLESEYVGQSGYDTWSADSWCSASADLYEITHVSGQPSSVNIIIETGGANKWSSSNPTSISKDYLERWHVANGSLVKDDTLSTYTSMGDPDTFQDFLEWGLTEYPADRTGVILWNHGGGMRGVCYDEKKNNDSLYDNEVLSAVSGAFNTVGRTEKLEFIGYDACLMGLQDVAEFNSPYFNYMVASQESEAGSGWDYDGGWLKSIYNNPSTVSTTSVLTTIVDTFITDQGGTTATGYTYQGTYYPADQTLAWYDLSKMAAYKTAWENLAGQLKNKINSSNKSTFNSNLIGKTKYFAGSDYDYFCTFDAYHFLTLLESNSTFNPGSTYINAAKNALLDLVGHSSSQTEAAHDAHGICFFYAAGTSDGQKSFSTSTYSNFTNWSYLSSTYGASITSTYSY